MSPLILQSRGQANYCYKNNLVEELTVYAHYLSVSNPVRANAAALYGCISEALGIVGNEA